MAIKDDYTELSWEPAELDLSEEIAPEDYVFILRPDGQVKSVMLPENGDEITDEMKEIMKYFETQYLGTSEGHTLH